MATSGNNQYFNVTIGANMDPSGVLGAVKQMQGAFNGLKLPTNLTTDIVKDFEKLKESLSKFDKLSKQDHFSKADLKSLEKLQKEIDSTFNRLSSSFDDLSGRKFFLDVDYSKIKEVRENINQIKSDIQSKLSEIKIDFSSVKGGATSLGLDEMISGMERGVKSSKVLSSAMNEVKQSLQVGNFSNASIQISQIVEKANTLKGAGTGLLNLFKQWGLVDFSGPAESLVKTTEGSRLLQQGLEKLLPMFNQDSDAVKELTRQLTTLTEKEKELEATGQRNYADAMKEGAGAAHELGSAMQDAGASSRGMANEIARADSEIEQLKQSTQYFFSLRNMLNLLKRGVKEAFETIKELDAAMTETAVVTDFSVGDMWKKLPEYTANANALGASVKDMYEATTLYYQQGLDTDAAMGIANETMKMARIGGLEAADATDKMTAALRGFNMELNETSAQRVNDVYSNLAAKTASDTEELGTAMQRTASIAASAGMSFEGTAAFLAQAIETTREPAENLGTAMKTIVARFTELKKNPLEIAEVDGEEVDYNKVDTALKSIGVSLKDTNGQFRDLDQVFLDISQRWNNLSQTQQRYIATTAAGSRQQSRFIAMMSNYERTVELMDYANNSAGASNEQFGKTMESLEAKLNKFKNAWNEFLMGIMNDKWTKGFVDAGTTILNTVNKILDALTLNGKLGLLKSALSTFTAFTALKFAGRGANALIGGLGGMVDPQSSFIGGMRNGILGNRQAVNAAQAQAIYQPIVNELRAIRQLKDQELTSENQARLGAWDQYNKFKEARSNLANLTSRGKTYNLNDIQSQLTGLSGVNQNILMRGNGTAAYNMTSAILSNYYKQLGGDVKGRRSIKEAERYLNSERKAGNITWEEYFKHISDPALMRKALDHSKAGYKTADTLMKGMSEQLDARAGEIVRGNFLSELAEAGISNEDFDAWEKELYDSYYKENISKARAQAQTELQDTLKGKTSNGQAILKGVGQIGTALSQAGMGLQSFGSLLTSSANPALQLFGSVLSGIGTAISSFGGLISGLSFGMEALASSTLVENLASKLVTVSKLSEATATTAITAGLFALVAVIAGVVIAIKKHNENIKKAAEEVTQNYKDKSSENQSNIANLKQWKSELAVLSKGVDENGYNINLDTSDYEHYLEITDAIAKMNPEIVQGYNAQGHAIINNNKALEDTLALEEKRGRQILRDYTNPDSLTKLLKARNLELSQYSGGGSGKKSVDIVQQELKPRRKMRQEISGIGSELLAHRDSIDLSKLNIDIDKLAMGNEAEFRKVLSQYDTFKQLVSNAIDSAGDEWSDKSKEAIAEGFSSFEESSGELDELVQPVYEALSASATQTAGFKEMSDNLKAPFQQALKELATSGGFDNNGEAIGKAAKNMALKFASYNDIYMKAMDEVEAAHKQFALDLSEENYDLNTEKAIQDLEDLKANLEDTPEGHAISEWIDNEIRKIENHTSSAAKTIEEAWDTIAEKVSVAESALESFNKATEKDYSSAADDMRSIFDTVMDEEAYHTVGLGDETFWAGAESLLGTENIMDKTKEEVLDMMNSIEPFLKEGPEGIQNFAGRVAELSDELEGIEGVAMTSDGWFESIDENANPDAWKQIADYLNISEELLTSLINKSRQFRPWDFSDMGAIRAAYAADETVIHGTQKVDVTTTDENGEEKVVQAEKLFITDTEFRSRMGTDYYNKEKREDKLNQLSLQGIEVLPESLSDLSASMMKTQLGIEDWTGAIKTFGETGVFDKSEIYEAAKELYESELGRDLTTEEEDTFRESFNEEWTNWLDNYENPLLEPMQQAANDLSAIANKYLGRKEEDKDTDKDKTNTKDESNTTENELPMGARKAEEYDSKHTQEPEKRGFLQWLNDLAKGQEESHIDNINKSGRTEEELKQQADFWGGIESRIQQSAEKRQELENSYKENVVGQTKEELMQQNKDWWSNLFDGLNTSINDKLEESQESTQTETSTSETTEEPSVGSEVLAEISNQLSTGAESLNTVGEGLSLAGETLNTAGQNLTNAAAILATSNNGGQTNGLSTGTSNTPAPNQQSSASGIIVVDNSAALESFEAVQTSATETKTLVETPMTVSIDVSDSGLKKAADRVKTINEGVGSKNINVTATASDPGEVDTLREAVEAYSKLKDHTVKLKTDLSGASASSIDNIMDAIDDFHKKKDHSVTLTVNYKTNGTKTPDHQATGSHNHGYVAPPSFGSAAGGYGQLGPKGKGGLTLTGELGYEIAWIPSENRSMILGANGPQMVNLPGDAVVWTHEQSKKILKQKSIPAGSHAGNSTTGKTTGGWNYSGYGGGNNVAATVKKAANKVSNAADDTSDAADEAKDAANAVQRVSVWWENMGRRVDNTQRKIDTGLDKIEKKFETFGTTAQSMKKLLTGYKKNLKTSISLNKREIKKAKAELKSLDTGKAAASQSERQAQWENGAAFIEKISYKSGDDTKTVFADLSGYIKKLKDGSYIVDQNALDKIANRDQRKATADAANKAIDDRLSKLTKAEDNLKKAREALAKLADDVYTTFYQWEKSITNVYILSQKLEQLNSRLTTASSRAELQYSKLLAGITDSAEALPEILQALTDQRTLMVNKVNAAQANVGATEQEYLNSISLSTYQNRYNKAKKANGGVVSKEASNDLKAARQALALFNRANGDYEKAVRNLNKKNISEKEYDAIKKVLDDIYSKQNAFLDAQNNAYSTVKEIYDKIEEYQSYISEFETDLLSGLEKETEEQVKHLDKLNSSLTKAYKDLLDEVKRKLDERRKQEDNQKTEDDISKKQQRLAALRADTSGGHQVEIAQLEKEIAEAQQNYQRTLEDQLLEKLQQQGDEAEKQRQRQIELLEAQNEIASELGTNLEQVKIWLSDPEQYFEDIKNAWLENKGYSDATPGEQKQLLEQFESAWTQYRAYTQDLPQFMEIAGSRLADISDSNDRQVGSLKATEDYLSTISNDLKVLRTYGVSVAEAVQRGYTQKDIHDAGYTASQFKEGIPEATIKDAMAAGYSKMEAATAYGALEALTTGNISGSITQKATGASAKEMQQIINSDSSGNAVQKDLAGVKLDKFDSNGSKKGGTNISGAQLSDTGKSVGAHKGSTFYWQDWDEKTGKVTGKVKSWTIDKLPAKYVGAQPDARQALKYAITHQEIGSIINKNMKELVNSSDAAKKYFIGQNFSLKGGYTGSMGSQGNILYNKDGTVWVWNPSTGANKVYKKYKKSTYLEEAKKNGNTSAAYARALIQRKAYTKAELEKKGITKFKTGGLATSTGPAWLDGTPSKPELVLSATDTKNFLALKDVLAGAMKGMGDTSNTYGDILYEININVDKIEKDYDVDRVVEKVKKEITKGAGYRNVTQVRNLR